MVSQDQDMEFKLRMFSILWRLGYYTRLNVKLVSDQKPAGRKKSGSARVNELTDIDVLGIKFDDDYFISYAVADCKTGGISPVARTFWLKGVMEHFQADRGYEVISKKLTGYEKHVAARLGITLLDEEGLQALETRYSATKNPLLVRLADKSVYDYYENNISTISNELNELISFRKYEYWQNSSNRNILRVISILRKSKQNLDPRQKFHRILLLDIAALFSISFLEICSSLFKVASDDVMEALRTNLFGGPLALQTKEALVKSIQELIEKTVIQPALIPEESKRRISLDPEYLPKLADMARRFILKPSDAGEVPRYFQAVLFERALYSGATIKEIFTQSYSEITYKFLFDVSSFLCDATDIPEKLFTDLS